MGAMNDELDDAVPLVSHTFRITIESKYTDEVETIQAIQADIDKTRAELSNSNTPRAAPEFVENEQDQLELDEIKDELRKSAASQGIEVLFPRPSADELASLLDEDSPRSSRNSLDPRQQLGGRSLLLPETLARESDEPLLTTLKNTKVGDTRNPEEPPTSQAPAPSPSAETGP